MKKHHTLIISLALSGVAIGASLMALAQEPVISIPEHVRGNATAPVRLTIYGGFYDFDTVALDAVIDQLVTQYGDKVSVSFHHFVDDFAYPKGRTVAEAAECAHEQGKFWEYYDRLIVAGGKGLTLTELKQYARTVDVPNRSEFDGCLSAERQRAVVSEFVRQAKEKGVTTSPTVFINTRKIEGLQSVATYQTAIDAELAAPITPPVASPVPPTPVEEPTVTRITPRLTPAPVPTVTIVPLPSGYQSGTLVKLADNPAVYYLGADGLRYAFPNSHVYFSWYGDFSNIRIISAESLANIRLAGIVKYRPGKVMVKSPTSPEVYVVGRGGVLRKIPSEAVATLLYGVEWNKNIHDVPDGFWTSYTFGDALTNEVDFTPEGELDAASTINQNLGY